MKNLPVNSYSDWLIDNSDSIKDLIDVCEEYFEVSIGYRTPTDSEIDRACKLMADTVVGGISLKPKNIIEIRKSPVMGATRFDTFTSNLRVEYATYVLLSKYRGVVDGPYIPMFRYERLFQRKLNRDGDYSTALIRQIALFQTYFRMKSGVPQKMWFEKLGWRRSLESAYRGEDLFGDTIYNYIEDIWDARCNYAHEWRTYIENETPSTVREAYRKGIYTLTKLLKYELNMAYSQYSSTWPSPQFPSHFARREYIEPKFGPASSKLVQLRCENCGEEFNPWVKGYERCPECGSKHDFKEQQSQYGRG